MHRTAFGHARIDHCGDPATTPLDFQGRTGTLKIRVARGQNRDLGRPRGLSVTETWYQHGFTSPSPWWRPTDATRRGLSRPPPVAGGHARGEAVERWGADDDGVAATATMEPLRVGNAMLCIQREMGNAVEPKRWLSRPPPVAGGPARRGGRALGADGDGVAAVVMVEGLRVGSAL
jgi:hypothetical protein